MQSMPIRDPKESSQSFKHLAAPELPQGYGPRNEEDQRVFDLVNKGINSGAPLAVDASYFARLRARIAAHKHD